jgi:hypothetical protein
LKRILVQIFVSVRFINVLLQKTTKPHSSVCTILDFSDVPFVDRLSTQMEKKKSP